ncbi:LysR family transcriptional regulator [Burkholderiaceae bacterium DAT-1]|nr:LysR family transcriptional regulator [Burkholderiaceae bacterium DAT-1]
MHLTDALHVFVRVAELNSFSLAAEQLNLPRATVSTAIKQLEHQLGTRLLHRTTRRVTLTDDGHACLARCKTLLGDLDELQSLFNRTDTPIAGRIRVDMPIAIARETVIPALPAFMQRHPDLRIELGSTDRRIDLLRDGYDCVIRVGTIDDPQLIARQLGHLHLVNCASPAYLQQYGHPSEPEQLARFHLVHYQATPGRLDDCFTYVQGTSIKHIRMPARITVNQTDAYLRACLAGLGIAQIPLISAQPYLDAGRLQAILPAYTAPPMPVSLIYLNRQQPRRLRVFMDWITDLLRPGLTA